MASQPEKILLHQERERVLALGRLFAPDPERPGEIAIEARLLPLPEGLSRREAAACELKAFLSSPFADVRRLAASAAEAVAAIQQAHRARVALTHHWCTRCKRIIDVAQFESSMERWGKPYCRHCLDEKELESHDFESRVEAAKQRRTEGGTAVQSLGEKRIAEFLEAEKIDFVYDERYRISGADLIRPDFYLPEFDVYIEYYGMDTPEYNENRRRKHVLYQRAAKKLISVSFKDDAELIATLKKKLSRYIRFEEGK